MTKIATQLSETGRRALAEFLTENLNDKALRGLFSAWEDDVSFDINDGTGGHLEIGSYYSKTGNPVVRFFGDDEVILEDIEVDAPDEPMFRLAEENAEWSQSYLLDRNADDPELCSWFNTAQIGDECPHFAGLVRIS